MSKLADLLMDLGQDAELHDEYVKDPQSVHDRYGLTDEESKAMLDRDVETVKRLSGLDNVKANTTVKAY